MPACARPRPTNSPSHSPSAHTPRRTAQDNYLVAYFGLDRAGFDAVGADAFKRQTYLSQIAMALNIKMKVESKRSNNCFGTMIWQLGESCSPHDRARLAHSS